MKGKREPIAAPVGSREERKRRPVVVKGPEARSHPTFCRPVSREGRLVNTWPRYFSAYQARDSRAASAEVASPLLMSRLLMISRGEKKRKEEKRQKERKKGCVCVCVCASPHLGRSDAFRRRRSEKRLVPCSPR